MLYTDAVRTYCGARSDRDKLRAVIFPSGKVRFLAFFRVQFQEVNWNVFGKERRNFVSPSIFPQELSGERDANSLGSFFLPTGVTLVSEVLCPLSNAEDEKAKLSLPRAEQSRLRSLRIGYMFKIKYVLANLKLM